MVQRYSQIYVKIDRIYLHLRLVKKRDFLSLVPLVDASPGLVTCRL
jgi:hypothetical protein